jgi:hypothetical protein
MITRSTLLRGGAWTAAAVLAAGLASGIGYAASSGGSANGSGPAAAPQPPGHRPGYDRGHDRGPGGALGGRWLRRLEHGQLTFAGRNGDRTVDIQRGTVTAVSASSISVRSQDGFAATYQVKSTTRIRKAGQQAAISSVHDGDRVLVIASGGVALRIRDLGTGPAPTPASTS